MNKRKAFSVLVALLLLPGLSQARYLNVNTGRFQTLDTFQGNNEDPLSLHKYLYAQDNPVNLIDPYGLDPLSAAINGRLVHKLIAEDFVAKVEGGVSGPSISTILDLPYPQIALFPDLVDTQKKKLYEIKPILSYPLGVAQLAGYIAVFNYFDPQKGWKAGTKFDYWPPNTLYLGLGTWAEVYPPENGVILYDVTDVPSLTLITGGALVTIAEFETADLLATVGIATLDSLMGAP
jgi:hypothetical protein